MNPVNPTDRAASLDNTDEALQFRPEDTPLQDDVRTLGKILGETLIRIEGLSLYNRVERVRQAAIARRRGDADADRRLGAMLSELDPQVGITLARAFATYFTLVNMAERIHGIRQHLRDLENEDRGDAGSVPPESYTAVLRTLKQSGIGVDALAAILKDMTFTPVFTAHPTEAVRRTLLRKELRIARDLFKRIDPQATSRLTNEAAIAQLRHEVGVGWQTDELFDQPSVADEVEHVLFFLSEVVYRVIPALYRRLGQAVAKVYGSDPVSAELTHLVRFASWVGGDMDGNPNVDATTIRATLQRQREMAITQYRRELRELSDHLSHSQRLVEPAAAFRQRVEHYRQAHPQIYRALPERYREMPYRVFLHLVDARLQALLDAAGHGYADVDELLADLSLLIESLRGHGDTGSVLVGRLRRRVQTFGFHMVTLDVRQDSQVHRAAVAEALGEPRFVDLDRGRRAERLAALLAQPVATRDGAAADSADSAESDDSDLGRCLQVMWAIRDCRERYGADAIGAYIISMAEGPDDALAVLYLARLAGLCDERGDVPLDVAPLFETVDDLNRAAATMDELLHDANYRAHLRGRDRHQIVMIGYSDSNKESGLAASRWALYSAQRALVAVADSSPGSPVELTLFHGRGGTISRGGGGLHPRNGILGEPAGAMRGRLRVTEQGEIISQKYGLRDTALRTMEMTTGALLERCAMGGGDGRLPPEWLEVAEFIADRSRVAYRELVHQDADLIPYFRAATPIDVIERLRIGSRPPSRRAQASVADLRAIPWVFAWTQSRHLLTGWYGVGSGLAAAADRYGVDTLRAMSGGWRYFSNLIADTEMVLAKVDMQIARHYADLAGAAGERLFPRLLGEFETTCRYVCLIQSQDQLLQHEPTLYRNISLRNPYVDPLSLLQVDFLRRWRDAGRDHPELERALVITVKGIARGMQNTG